MPANLFEAYISGRAAEFFDGAPGDPAARRRAVERAARPLSAAVLAVLREQNARYGPSASRADNLGRLARGAAAVVTGQQVGLFLGPLYTVYKAASAIQVARALAAETGRDVVPVFWLQTEDHDLPEIANCAVPRSQREPLSLALPASADERVSIAHLKLPDQIRETLAQLEAELGDLPHARAHLDRLARHYRPGAGWSDAFAGVLAELFEPEGLLLIDPREPSLAREVADVHAQALTAAEKLASGLLERGRQLERAGFGSGVHVREGAPLCFYHPNGPSSPRHRLVASGSGFAEHAGERRYELAVLIETLRRDPLSFSTSALLRPIVQDRLLPTAAYVGGPAEVAYFAQLAPLYAAFELPLPLVIARARFRVLEPSSLRLLTRLGLPAAAVEQPEERLLEQLMATGDSAAKGVSPEDFQRKLRDGFERVLAASLAEIGPQADALAAQVAKTREKLDTTSGKLAEKYAVALARGDQARVDDVRRLQGMLFPRGMPQERCFGFAYFAARYGERAFLELVLREIEPFQAGIRELRP